MAPVSPSAARTALIVNDRLTDGEALASLTTCVRNMVADEANENKYNVCAGSYSIALSKLQGQGNAGGMTVLRADVAPPSRDLICSLISSPMKSRSAAHRLA